MPKTKIVHNSLNYVVISVFCALLGVGGYFYSTMQKTSINEINIPQVTAIPIPIPTTSPRVCETVTTFSLSGSCGNNNYQTVSFTCGTSKSIQTQGGKSSCKSVASWYSEAQSACVKTCPTLKPTPSPKITPTPNPTPTPTPSPIIPSYCYPFSMSRWYTESCGTGTYRYVNYQCYEMDSVRVIGSPISCNTLAQWDEQVKVECNKICPFPSTTATPPTASSVPK